MLLLVLLLLLVVLVVAALAVVNATSSTDAVAQDEPGPVLLVSGYGGSTAALEPMRAALQSQGRDVVVVPAVGGGTGDLGVQAKALRAAATAAMERFHASSVDVVGYSAGGLVARSWVRDLGGGSVARRVVSVGTPQHGTSVAELAAGAAGCPTACEQLEPDSAFLRELDAGDETPSGPRFVSVWSTTDRTVVPPSSARLAGAALDVTVQSLCPGARVSHGDLPSDPTVLAVVRAALGAGPPRRPPSPPC